MKNKTLLVDGNALFKTAYYGVKYTQFRGEKIGGIFQTINIIRKLVKENRITRIVVMWDGENSINARVRLYPLYKSNRDRKRLTDKEHDNYHWQYIRVKEYMEELFIRQYITQNCEADDAIAYYVQNRKPNEEILIITNDRDILQLLAETVNVYLLDKKYVINPNNFQMFFPYYYKNVKVVKILTGDKSDCIHGISGLGTDDAIEKLITLVPSIREREVTLDEVFAACEEKKDDKICQNILSGRSPKGIFNKEFYVINERLIDLNQPLIEGVDEESVKELLNESMNAYNRNFRNLLKMMIKDGTINLIPGSLDKWEDYVQPFIKIVKNEKYN